MVTQELFEATKQLVQPLLRMNNIFGSPQSILRHFKTLFFGFAQQLTVTVLEVSGFLAVVGR